VECSKFLCHQRPLGGALAQNALIVQGLVHILYICFLLAMSNPCLESSTALPGGLTIPHYVAKYAELDGPEHINDPSMPATANKKGNTDHERESPRLPNNKSQGQRKAVYIPSDKGEGIKPERRRVSAAWTEAANQMIQTWIPKSRRLITQNALATDLKEDSKEDKVNVGIQALEGVDEDKRMEIVKPTYSQFQQSEGLRTSMS